MMATTFVDAGGTVRPATEPGHMLTATEQRWEKLYGKSLWVPPPFITARDGQGPAGHRTAEFQALSEEQLLAGG